ncbi:S8 family peptidase [Nonomuraea typhae]|uniref:S8 family peptidase n=1 Tax=Nonomuraea typhae TaxID=2603600 RepID=UPI0012FB60FF|nr:S8 family serine peptidase [Nonomuraea typhae]
MHRLARATAAAVMGPVLGVTLLTALPAAAQSPDTPLTSRTVTLITGDVVTVTEAGGGRKGVAVKPGPGRERIRFHSTEENGRLRILPSDAIPLLTAKRIDPALFSVSDLIEQGYDDASTATLPLLFTYEGRPAARAGVTATLESVNGQAVAAGKTSLAGMWKTGGVSVAGVRKVWLDAKVGASLDQSVVQVGAPQAWQAGLDGKGVKVAVLDTGVDQDHPDLRGRVKESKVFTGEPSVKDGHGHGTHVAATIAGGPQKKGVAPGADLIVGKVLSDGGLGSFSQIIEGMEWAVAQGAAVVNMSLGGDATDGTDPLSTSLNTLSAQSGALFVVAAGNEGRPWSVGTPGAADSALTVGAVDRQDALAGFSSQGPRLDGAPKPDITAPGVGIVAARAAGTTLGDPVSETHTAASGTSMATPHVAGAAAILKQRHPDWTAAQLKNALVGTAKTIDGQTIHQQGGGRLDVARATRQGVTATGVLDLGVHSDGTGPGAAEGQVTYTNGTAAPVTLTPGATLAHLGEGGPAGGAITLDPPSVTVAAGGTATVKVRADLAKLERGRYGGYLTASAGTESVHTTLAITKQPPAHKVHVIGIDPAGERTSVPVITMFGASREDDVLTYIGNDAKEEGITLEVFEGTYMTQAIMGEFGPPHYRDSLVVTPELKVDRDLEIVLDARKANPVTIKTPQPVEQAGVFTYVTHRAYGSRKIIQAAMNFDSVEGLNVTPTEPVRDGSFEFASRWQLQAPRISAKAAGRPYPMIPMAQSPEFDGRHRWPLVEGTAGSRGRAALLPTTEEDDWSALIGEAARQGARAAIIITTPGQAAWQRWWPVGERDPIPTLMIAADHGQKLLEQVRKGRAVLDVTAAMASPYLYEVMQVSGGHVPERVVHEVTSRNTARVETTYQEAGGYGWAKEQRYGWRPWQFYDLDFQGERQRIVKTPLRRTEYLSADGTQWQHIVNHLYAWESLGQLRSGLTEPPRSYRPGEKTGESWHAPVVRPAIPAWGPAATRTGDTLTIMIPDFVDASGHASRRGADEDTSKGRLLRDGTVVAEMPYGAWGEFPVAPGDATYRLELSTTRTSEEWTLGVATETAWTFGSKRGQELLPLLQVDYAVRTDVYGKAGRASTLGFSLRHQDGVTGLKPRSLQLELSYDDGRTWRGQPVLPLGQGRFSTIAVHPRGAAAVSMRVKAADSGGNTVEQTVTKAFGIS